MKKEKGLINLLLTLITIILIFIVIFFGYLVYIDYFGDATLVIGEAGYPIIENTNVSQREDNNEPIGEIDISDTSIQQDNSFSENFFYSQLSDSAKLIYTELYKNKENLKTGTFTVQFGDSFKDILSQENGSDKLKEEYQSAIEAFTYENPDVFYLDVTKMYINIEMIKRLFTTKYNVYINSYQDPNYLAEPFYSKENVDKCQAEIESVRDEILAKIEGKNVIEKIRYIHNYLIDNIEYEQSIQKDNIYNIYGALVQHESVCEGYAKACQYLLDSAGIENIIVTGTATNNNGETENHAWNYVKINDAWYALDVTWDDPIIIGGGNLSDEIRYQYFLKGSNTMNKNHYVSNKFTDNGKEFNLPKLSPIDYRY